MTIYSSREYSLVPRSLCQVRTITVRMSFVCIKWMIGPSTKRCIIASDTIRTSALNSKMASDLLDSQ